MEFQLTPELNEFFKKVYELKTLIKNKCEKSGDSEMIEVYDFLNSFFLPNKEPEGMK